MSGPARSIQGSNKARAGCAGEDQGGDQGGHGLGAAPGRGGVLASVRSSKEAVNMQLERVALSRLNPAAYNPRLDLKPGDPEYEKLKRSLDEFGLVEPVVWNKRTGHIVGGHQRFKLLVARGDTHATVSVVDLPLEREKALNIALNKVSGGWDTAKLAELLDELVRTPGFEIELTGFDPPEVDLLLAETLGQGAGRTQSGPEPFDAAAAMAEAEALKGPAITGPGEMLSLGDHLLLCGDCTDRGALRALVRSGGRGKAVLFATDPPYLVNYDGTNHFTSTVPRSKRARGGGDGSGGARARTGAKDPDDHPGV